MPFSMPFTMADMATRLETPRMMPSMVRAERNLCAQISFSPIKMALVRFISAMRLKGFCVAGGRLDSLGFWKRTFALAAAPPGT